MSKKGTFFQDFKTFITRGNVIDMAVGVIVGGAFTAIVNSLSNNILRPVINWLLAIILGKNSLSEVYTFLQTSYKTDESGVEVIDLADSIYIDWGAFVNAIINFFIIASVLFVIVRTINNLRDINTEIKNGAKKMILTKEEIDELKANKVNIRDRKAVDAYFEEKERIAKEAEEKAKEEERLAAEKNAEPTMSDLIVEMKELIQVLKEK